MGIRVHKTIGYSAPHPDRERLEFMLDDQSFDGEVAALLGPEKLTGMDAFDHPNCIIYLPNGKQEYPKTFNRIVHTASGCDILPDDPIIIVPPSMAEKWDRRDDTIDYWEEFSKIGENDTPVNRVVPVYRNLYPYSGWMTADGQQEFADYNKFPHEIKEQGLVPLVPKSVRIIATHLGFNWVALRPVIATYWC